ncbi:MAG: carboxypeptidase regulatory-like domain-containing protein [Brevundimonas sp.]|nr:carboxypeptidase regulatory-like domain-containing protein [Brevundimonas sp.]
MNKLAAGLLALACATLAPLRLPAQSLAGSAAVSGTVLDPSNAPVPGAQVLVSNTETGLTRRLVTNSSGYFLAASLTPGKG